MMYVFTLAANSEMTCQLPPLRKRPRNFYATNSELTLSTIPMTWKEKTLGIKLADLCAIGKYRLAIIEYVDKKAFERKIEKFILIPPHIAIIEYVNEKAFEACFGKNFGMYHSTREIKGLL
ncbi:protein kinase superfamily protein [Striga asiatica]|uniref:Protein kinase superfamily protein n=1 Tax=Striga asiatica TaxID=4170 RepID=A0A5A7PSH7_STRAF|nr:protein kinase superfamily protein [Striga asiatica]